MDDQRILLDRLSLLISEGLTRKGISDSIDISIKPEYYNDKRFKEAQASVNKYFVSIAFASSAGLMLLLRIESILIPLLKTGKSRTVANLYTRYADTGKYMRSLYETDFHDDTTKGWSYLMLIRGMHERIYKIMNEDETLRIEPPNVWINQHDMALTQFAFVGLLFLWPQKCGAFCMTRDEQANIAYYWRIISYYLGIEENFNLFVFHEDVEKQTAYMKLVLDHMLDLPGHQGKTTGLSMCQGFMHAFEDLSSEASFNVVDRWWRPEIMLSGQPEPAPYSFGDTWRAIIFAFEFKVLLRSELVLSCFNYLYKRKFDKFEKQRPKTTKKLQTKYPNERFELEPDQGTIITS